MKMNTCALILALFVACINCFSEQEYQSTFTNWMQSNKKAYVATEFQARYATFKSNMDYIQQWNAVNNQTKLGLNIFADLTNEEYRNTYLGTRVKRTPLDLAPSDVSTLPSSVDWRDKGAVSAVKNQGQCGACWSFSTTGSVEGITQISTGTLVSLSEQNLIDCSSSYGNEGCNGGTMDAAFKYIISNGGIDTEDSYPYQAQQGSCQYNAANSAAIIAGFFDVSSGSESQLQIAVAQQPVSVAIDASHNSFQLYSSGVYYESACSSSNLDHGVLVIGYGSSDSDYWIVKNSWGVSWGQDGYIWMARNKDNNCGIATMASYPTATNVAATTHKKTSTHHTSHVATHSQSSHSQSSHSQSSNGQSTYSNGLNSMYKNSGGRGFKPQKDQVSKFNF